MMTLHDYTARMHAKLQHILPVPGVRVSVGEPGGLFPALIPRQGIGAYTHGFVGQTVTPRGTAFDTLHIYISADLGWDRRDLEAKLPYVLAHEWHHAARLTARQFGSTLWEVLVSEGLADHFAHGLTPYEAPWCHAVPDEDVPGWEALARAHGNVAYSHPDWFFGEDRRMPPWLGYTLGYAVVGRYLVAHDTTARDCVRLPALAVWQDEPMVADLTVMAEWHALQETY